MHQFLFFRYQLMLKAIRFSITHYVNNLMQLIHFCFEYLKSKTKDFRLRG